MNSASIFAHTAEFLRAQRLLALRIVGEPDVVRFVRGQVKIFHPAIGVEQILEHARHQFVGIGVGGAELIITVGIFAQLRVFGMLQDERDVARTVEERNELHVMLKCVIR